MDMGSPPSALVNPEPSMDSKTIDTTTATVGTIGLVPKQNDKRKHVPNVARKAPPLSSEKKKKSKQGVRTPPGRKAKGKTDTAAEPSDSDDADYADGDSDADD
ncbi:hypothetical protein ACA910_012284 [Epithemia clementina (nom. ined.)]